MFWFHYLSSIYKSNTGAIHCPTQHWCTPDINHHRTTQHNVNSVWFYSALQFIRYQNLSAVYTTTGHHRTTQHITIYNVISIRFYRVLQFIRYQYFITAFKYILMRDANNKCFIPESAASSAISTVRVGLMMAMTYPKHVASIIKYVLKCISIHRVVLDSV
jgi:hypothetical protein